MFFDALESVGSGCVNLAGSISVSGPASRSAGQSVTLTAVTTGITAGTTPLTYTWTVLTHTGASVPITSGQGTTSITYTQSATSIGSTTGTLVVSNCGGTTLSGTKTVTKVA